MTFAHVLCRQEKKFKILLYSRDSFRLEGVPLPWDPAIASPNRQDFYNKTGYSEVVSPWKFQGS